MRTPTVIQREPADRRQNSRSLTPFWVATAAALALLLPAQVWAGFYQVTTAVDGNFPGSIRYAFERAATETEDSVIEFTVAGPINLNSALPTIVKPTTAYDLTVTGNGVVIDGGATSFGDGLVVNRAGWVAVAQLSLQNFKESGVRFVGEVTGGSLTDLSVSDNEDSGLKFSGTNVVNVQVRDSVFAANGDDGITFANNTAGHRIVNCTVDDNFTNGIKLSSGVTGVLIEATSIQTNIQNGVHIIDGATDNDIGPDNTIDANRQGGVLIEGNSSQNNRITGNTSIDTNDSFGIRMIAGASRIWVVGNGSISNNSLSGLSLESGVADVFVLDNGQISNNAIYGIRMQSSVDNAVILGNTIVGNDGGVGILAAGGTNITIGATGRGNQITTHSAAGVRINGADGVSIQDNQIESNGIGLEFSSSNNMNVGSTAGNTVRFNSTGIYVVSSSQVVIAESTITNNGVGGVLVSGASDNIDIGPNNAIQDNDEWGINLTHSGTNVSVVDNDIGGGQFSGIAIDSSAALIQMTGNDIYNHTDHAVWSSGVSIAAANDVRIEADNHIYNNASGVLSIDSGVNGVFSNNDDVGCTSTGLRNNLSTGLRLLGGTWTVENNCVVGNGDVGILVEPESTLFSLNVAEVTVRNNTFGGHNDYGIRVRESYTQNLSEFRGGTHGNDFSGETAVGFSQQWYGLIRLVNSQDDLYTGDAICNWTGRLDGTVTEATSNGFCPENANLANPLAWPLVEELHVLPSGAVVDRFPHAISVVAAGSSTTGQFGWDGCETAADQNLAGGGGFNIDNGSGAPCPANRKRSQVAELTVYPAPSVQFFDELFEDTLSTVLLTVPDGQPEFNLQVQATELPDFSGPITALVQQRRVVGAATQVVDYETITLSDTPVGMNATKARTAMPVVVRPVSVQTSPVIGDGVVDCADRDHLRARFWNTEAPGNPFAQATISCQEQTPPAVVFCRGQSDLQNGDLTEDNYFDNVAVSNLVIGEPIQVCLRDLDEDSNPNFPDTISSADVSIQVLRTDGVNLTLKDSESLSMQEIAASGGNFFNQITGGDFVNETDTGVEFVNGDGVVQCAQGDTLRVTYEDKDNGASSIEDLFSYSARCVLPPTVSGLQLLTDLANQALVKGGSNPTGLQLLAPNQWFYFDVTDANRAQFTFKAESIAPGEPEAPVNEQDAILRSLITVESFSPSGQRLDWERLQLKETGNSTQRFRGRVFTSSHFGENENFAEPNGVLLVQSGGTVRASYVDEFDPGYNPGFASQNNQAAPCVSGLPYDCASQTVPVIAEAPFAVTFGDRFGHPSSQLFMRQGEEPLRKNGVMIRYPPLNASPTTAETLTGTPLGNVFVQNLTRRDGYSLVGGQETAANSDTFLLPFAVKEEKDVSTASQLLESQFGNLVYLRFRDPGAPNDQTRWAHDTAVLCRNAPSFIEVTQPTDDGSFKHIDRIELGDEAYISVFDEDQNADFESEEIITINVAAAQFDDFEAFNLIETGPNTGHFRRTVRFPGNGDAVPGDGRVRIADRDTVTITYSDSSFETEDSTFCSRADQSVVTFFGQTKDRTTALEFINRNGKRIYDLPAGDEVRVRVRDIKANVNINAVDAVTVDVFLDPERMGRPVGVTQPSRVSLQETGDRSAVFEGAAVPSPQAAMAAAPSLAEFGPLIGSWYSAVYYDTGDPTDDIIISAPIVAQPLKVTITTRPKVGAVGDAVMVEVVVWNPNRLATLPAELMLSPFRGLPAAKDSLFLDGKKVTLPPGRPWKMQLGQIEALSGRRLVWTAAVSPIAKGKLNAWGEVWAQDVLISERGQAEFRVIEEPLFTRSTVFVNVFHDANENGMQEFTEPRIPGARIVSGDGFSTRTDKNGQAHFANLRAGPNGFRLDMRSLPPGWKATTPESQFVELFEGMLHTVSFGVRPTTETVTVKAKAVPWKEIDIETVANSVPISGSLDEKQLTVGARRYPMLEADVKFVSQAANALYLSDIRAEDRLQIDVRLQGDAEPQRWTLILYPQGETVPVQRFSSAGAPPPQLALNADTAENLLKPGRDYDLQLKVWTATGIADSGRRPYHVYLEPPQEEVGVASQFQKGQASLDPYTILALREAAFLLQNYPDATVRVEGFTDNTGSDAVNRQLSRRRAEMAKEYLVIVEGVRPERIFTEARGATNFIAPNDTEANRARNRRVEISVFGLPKNESRVFKPSVISADGSEVQMTKNNRFSTQGQVSGNRLIMNVQFPSGATYSAAVSIPGTGVSWEQGAVVVPPEFVLPVRLNAPVGTTVTGLGPVIRMDAVSKTVDIALKDKAALRVQFFPPVGPAVAWVGLVKLRPTRKSPPGLARVQPDRFMRLNIPAADVKVRSGSWKVTGTSAPGTVVRVNEKQTEVDAQGRFAVDIEVPDRDTFDLDVSAYHPVGVQAALKRSWTVDDRSLLHVGVVQLSAEHRRENDYGTGERNSEWLFKGFGRFYVEGTLPGDVLLKARVRTEDRPLETFLPDLLDYDGPAEDLIDPNRTYLVYGDGSTTVDEAPGAGPIVLFVGWKGQVFEIGTVDLDERPSIIDSRVETSYGARIHLSTATHPTASDTETSLDALGTRPNSARAQDRLAATGGLVYYLRNADVQEGSERIWVEEEDTISGARTTTRVLRHGEDYTIDYLSGRIWLLNPLALAGPGETIVRESALSSNNRWLVVSYRYRPGALVDAAGHGEMLQQELGRWGDLGIMYREEEEDGIIQRRGRTWIELTPVTGTSMHFEAGRRWGDVEQYAVSLDGGLTYRVTSSTNSDAANAFAGGAKTRIGDVEIAAHGRHLDQGYGGLRYSTSQTVDAGGVSVAWDVRPDVRVGWRGDIRRTGDLVDAQDRIHASHPAGPLEMSYEMRHQALDPGLEEHHRLDGGLRAVYPLPPRWRIYGEHQQELFQSGAFDGDALERRSTVGASYAFSATWDAFIEATEGNLERGGRIGGGYGGEHQRYTLSYGLSQNISSGNIGGIVGAGGRQQVGKRTTLTGAQEFRHGSRERGMATILGSQIVPIDGLTLGVEGERGRFIYKDENEEITRNAVRGRVLAKVANHKFEARAGWARQNRPGNDVISISSDDSWRARFLESGESLVRYRFARDVTAPGRHVQAEYQEWAVGAAYRPIQHNRMQLLSVLRWAKEKLTPSQDPSRALKVAAIGSVDGTVRILKPLEVGFKLAGKRSGIEFDGFKSDPVHTLLTAGRLAWIFFEPFDLLGEYRFWQQFETTQTLHGPLIELGIRPTDFIRFGMAYNFTTFRDEMRPHDRFDAEGFRLRLIGVF